MKYQHRTALLALAAGGSLATVAGCGGSATPPGSAVTVTVTPTVTAKGGGPTTSASPSAPGSDDVGRKFDYGAVVSARAVGGVTVLILDRYTWKGLDDAKLAQQGLPVKPFKGKVPYENLNTTLTYRLPVADGARILYHHCVAPDQPLQTKSVAPADLAGLHAPENTVLVTLDAQGSVTAAENIPACPG
ncbi:hypothetical protein [Pedococcus sp.]|uniref:hypothetical protein n=1 Tax=Pedococcus sp. TaxID=2860345 RepID=UPI002E14DCB3|nr:hypothetical protein [Pedococcus sp.]